MADTKISALTAATTPLAGTEVLPIVQGGITKKVTVADLTAGRAISALSLTTTGNVTAANMSVADSNWIGWGNYNSRFTGTGGGPINVVTNSVVAGTWDASQNYTFYVGNLVQGTAAKGINFTANTGAAGMTSQLLNWYEEGTWTPVVQFGGGTTGITYSRQNGRYTRVGKLVTVTWDVRLSNKGSSTGAFVLAGLPFSAEGAGGGYATSQFYFYSGFLLIKKMGTSYTNGSTTLNEIIDSADVAVSDTNFTNSSILFGSFTYLSA